MKLVELQASLDLNAAGEWMHDRVREWYPLCRSITGQGLRDTLAGIAGHIPLERTAVSTGTPVFDWTIPNEWNIRDGYIKNAQGERVVDFNQHNLHVMGYSVPVSARMSLEELLPHCHTNPEQPDAIPYRTSYYKEDWGFCLSQRQMDALTPGEYEVFIDSTLAPGCLDYAQCVLPGETDDEIFFSAHVCHPSLANDNLSGVALAACLARMLQGVRLRHTLRFVFAPGTIGAIAWLAQHEAQARRSLKHGLILACVGDAAPFSYKQSRRGDALIDRAVAHALGGEAGADAIHPFIPYGYDERQYCSPGFDLPVGCFMRSGPGGYPQYHTSGDNLDIVRPEHLAGSLAKVLEIIAIVEGDARYRNLNPNCEPQLGRRGLYGMTGGLTNRKAAEMGMLWVLNYSDGNHSLLDIATKSGLSFGDIRAAADLLLDAGLLAPVERP